MASHLLRLTKLDELQAASALPLGRSTSTPTETVTRNTTGKTAQKLPTSLGIGSTSISTNAADRSAACIFGRSTPFETDFAVHEVVGEGGFGRIYKCKSNVDGRLYAVKLEQFWFKPQAYFDPSQVRDVMMNEALMLARLDHENVCRYFNTWVTGSLVPIDNVGKRSDVVMAKPADAEPAKRRYSPARRVSSSSDFASFVHAANRFVPARSSASFDEDDPHLEDIDESIFDLPLSRFRGHSFDEELLGFSDLGFDMEEDDSSSSTIDSSEYSEHSIVPAAGSHMPRRRQSMDLGANVGSLCTQIDVYIQMALYDGDTLQHWIEQRKSIDTAANLKIFHQIVAGLTYIHAQGLIHRDIKPANIFLTKDSCVKIGDFGLAKNTLQSSLHIPPSQYYLDDGSLDDDEPTTTTSVGVGTPLYSSPEQTSGQPCDASTDIFSLGILLCELFMSFSTQMERFVVLSALRKGVIPLPLVQTYPKIAELVEGMVCSEASRRLSCAAIEQRAVQSHLWTDCRATMMSATAWTPVQTQLSNEGVQSTEEKVMHSKFAHLLSRLHAAEEKQDTILQQLPPSEQLQQLQAVSAARKRILHDFQVLTDKAQ